MTRKPEEGKQGRCVLYIYIYINGKEALKVTREYAYHDGYTYLCM